MPIFQKSSRPSTGSEVQDGDGERSVFSRPKANILAMKAREVRVIMRLALEEESGGESAILAWQAGRGMKMTTVHACGSHARQRRNSTRLTRS
jgi:hypothetical protein